MCNLNIPKCKKESERLWVESRADEAEARNKGLKAEIARLKSQGK